jgi:2-methylcitrate dehydratase PrpD
MDSISEKLGKWISSLHSTDIPEKVRLVAKNCAIDTIGVALGGLSEPVSFAARDYASTAYAVGQSTVMGSPRRLSAEGAAFANATAAHALDFDDNSYAGVVHGSAVIIPAALAAVEAAGGSGTDFIDAIVAGSEAEYAVAVAATNDLYIRGWWTTPIYGAVGAAAAAAKAMKLSAEQTAAAIGIAISGAGGLKACFGTDAKPLLTGQAARMGVFAASLAAKGASGPKEAFEKASGFASMFAGRRLDAAPIDRLGGNWLLLMPGVDVKKYPVCLSGAAAADAVLDLMNEHKLLPEDVLSVRCDVPPVVAANLVYDRPFVASEARFSLPFAVACMIMFKDITLAHLSSEILADPRLQARGSRARPMSRDEFHGKFRDCAGRSMSRDKTEALLMALEAVEELRDLAQVVDPD